MLVEGSLTSLISPHGRQARLDTPTRTRARLEHQASSASAATSNSYGVRPIGGGDGSGRPWQAFILT